MLSAVIYLILITSVAGAIAVGFKLRIGHAYVPAICLTGLFTSLLLVVGGASSVRYIAGAAGILCTGFIIFRIVDERKRAYYILTTEFAVFTLLVIGMMLLNAGRFYYFYDEFSHWGLAVKNLFTVGKLPFGSGTNAIFRGYPPFATSICFLGTCFTGRFSESATFIPVDMLLIASTLPVLTGHMRQCAKKGGVAAGRCLAAVPVAAMIFSIMCFKLSAFTSIGVDTLMGVLAFYVVWESLHARRIIQIVSALSAAVALALIKDTGLAFAVFASVSVTCAVIARESGKKNPRAVVKSLAAGVLPLVLGATVAKLLWNCVAIIANASVGGSGMLPKLFKSAVSGFTETQKAAAAAFFKAWVKPLFSVGIPLVLVVAVFALLEFATVFLLKKAKVENVKTFAALFISVTACFFVYAFGVLASYLTVFSEEEAASVASFERYIGTYLTFWLCLIVGVAVCMFPAILIKIIRKKAAKEKTLRVLFSLVSLAVAVSAALFAGMNRRNADAAMREAENYGSDIPALCEEAGADTKDAVLIVSSRFDTRMHVIANYNAAPRKVVGMQDLEHVFSEKKAQFVYFEDVDDIDLVNRVASGIIVPEGEEIAARRLYRVAP